MRRLIVLGIIALFAPTAAARDKWISLRSPHFEAVSNAGEGRSRRLLNELEQFRRAFVKIFSLQNPDQVPVRVILFKNDGSFKPFKPLHDGKPANVAGFFQQGQDYDFIALDAGRSSDQSLRTIFHEYIHLLTRNTPYPWPLWLREGIAEFYSTYQVRGSEVTLGAPIPHHVDLLRRRTPFSLEELFQIGYDSVEYNESGKQGLFYAQSWALTHLIMLGEKGARRPLLTKFLHLIHAGEDPGTAFGKAFPTPLEELRRELIRYVNLKGVYVLRVKLDDLEEDREIAANRISEAEAKGHLADLLLHMDRLDEAEEMYRELLKSDAELPAAHEGLGLLAMRQGDHAKAQQHLKKAAAGDSANHLVHYYVGRSLLQEAGVFSGNGVAAEDFDRLAGPLRRSIELMPAFADSYYLLALLHLQAARGYEAGIELLQEGLRLSPQNEHYRVLLADLQLANRSWEAAQATLRRLAASNNLGIRDSAESRLRYLEYMKREAEPANRGAANPLRSAVEGGLAAASDTAPSDRSDPSSPPAAPPPKPTCFPDFVNVRTAAAIPGKLIRIDCEEAPIYVAMLNGKETRLISADPAQPALFSCDVRLRQFSCGPFEYDAVVYLTPDLETDPETGALKVLAIEFKKP